MSWGRRHFRYNFFIVLITVFFFLEKNVYHEKEEHNTTIKQEEKRRRIKAEDPKVSLSNKKTEAVKQSHENEEEKKIVDVRPSEIQWCYSEWGASRVPFSIEKYQNLIASF